MVSFELDASESLTFVWCPPGRYKQDTEGTPLSRKTRLEIVEVFFNRGFWMSNTSITNGQWRAIMGENYFEVGNFSRKAPIYGVNFEIVISFIDKLNSLNLRSVDLREGVVFSLPNYLQMRYGCFSRATDEDPLFWELNNDTFADYCWFNENSNDSIHDVALKTPSPGVYMICSVIFLKCRQM